MPRFLKILARNLLEGPATDPFPFKEAFTPKRLRGKVALNPDLCLGCGICRHVCPGEAIRIEPDEEGKGYLFSVWHNTCALCASCRHFCPTGAITLNADWHNAHLQTDKYSHAEHHFVPYSRCAGCGSPLRMLPPGIAARLYAHSPIDMTSVMKLCPSCRLTATAKREGERYAAAEPAE
ncbi:MAG: 4Fe-4S dicluster domain-containing protein [Deltaproteobacteria bacterium]|jgi:NAD-dependent dihydropyrimidine dehydrogenase PreA subunit|nr:4Fe-4S dicluster domain-containing protein [Deltaproteobacteria bacterium]